jgi:MoaA/NifB/PqqE/SkfB family radical SAM enzyme
MSLDQIRRIVSQADALGTIDTIDFEGGEPFLYHPVLCRGAALAAKCGYRVGVVTNGYWATSVEDAVEWLRPLATCVSDISLSDDTYHGSDGKRPEIRNACRAAENLGIRYDVIRIAPPGSMTAVVARGMLPPGESRLIYRGRAAQCLSNSVQGSPWDSFTECPYENLRDPGRVHVDPLGEVHLCQGISLGNVFQSRLCDIFDRSDPGAHPIVGPLLRGGPAELVRTYGIAHDESYADACHLCCEARSCLREKFPEILTPDQMYGVPKAT